MANAKAYISFVLLFSFLLSSHVLTHELPEGYKHFYNDGKNNFKHPTLSQDREQDRRDDSIMPSHVVHGYSVGYHPNGQGFLPISPPEDAKGHKHSYNDESQDMEKEWRDDSIMPNHMVHGYSVGYHPNGGGFVPFSSPEDERGHYTANSIYYLPSVISAEPPPPAAKEPENNENESVMRHRKMMRPSGIDWRSFHAFPAKTSSMTHGGKTSDGVPKMEDVDKETKN